MQLNFYPDLILLAVIQVLCMRFYLSPLPPRIKYKWLRIMALVPQTGLCLFANVIFFSGFNYATGIAYFLFVLVFIYTGYQVDFKTALFHTLLLFLCEHYLKKLCSDRKILGFFPPAIMLQLGPLRLSLAYIAWLVFGILYGLSLLALRRAKPHIACALLSLRDIVGMALTGLPVLFISYTSLGRATALQYFLAITAASLCGIILILNTLHVRKGAQDSMALERLKLAMQNQYDQFIVREQCSQVVHQCYHDIRNQLVALRANPDGPEMERYLEKLEKTIQSYEATYRTGNGVVDSILYEKGKRGAQSDVQLLCMADGALVAHMSALDICSLFGNILDNAIEAAEKLDKPLRSVLLKLTQYHGYVLLRCENGYTGTLTMDAQGEIESSKPQDGLPHGYGLRGIRDIVEKYGGSITLDTQEQRFVLSVLLPTT